MLSASLLCCLALLAVSLADGAPGVWALEPPIGLPRPPGTGSGGGEGVGVPNRGEASSASSSAPATPPSTQQPTQQQQQQEEEQQVGLSLPGGCQIGYMDIPYRLSSVEPCFDAQ